MEYELLSTQPLQTNRLELFSITIFAENLLIFVVDPRTSMPCSVMWRLSLLRYFEILTRTFVVPPTDGSWRRQRQPKSSLYRSHSLTNISDISSAVASRCAPSLDQRYGFALAKLNRDAESVRDTSTRIDDNGQRNTLQVRRCHASSSRKRRVEIYTNRCNCGGCCCCCCWWGIAVKLKNPLHEYLLRTFRATE